MKHSIRSPSTLKQHKKRYAVKAFYHGVYTVIDTHWNNQISTVSIDINKSGIHYSCSSCSLFYCNHIRAVNDWFNDTGITEDDLKDMDAEDETRRSLSRS